MPLRIARPDDLLILQNWDAQPHVQEATGADGSFDWVHELPRTVSWRELLIYEEGGRPIGFMQIIDPREEESHYWGDIEADLRAIDIWIGAAADLGRGHGTRMMQEAMRRCFADPQVQAIVIDPLASNVRAIVFYERLGFRAMHRRTFGEDDCLVMRLERADFRN